jgi:hypothetical protein
MDRDYAQPLDVPTRGADRTGVRGALHPYVPRHVRRDAEPLSAAASHQAGNVPPAVHRAQRGSHFSSSRLMAASPDRRRFATLSRPLSAVSNLLRRPHNPFTKRRRIGSVPFAGDVEAVPVVVHTPAAAHFDEVTGRNVHPGSSRPVRRRGRMTQAAVRHLVYRARSGAVCGRQVAWHASSLAGEHSRESVKLAGRRGQSPGGSAYPNGVVRSGRLAGWAASIATSVAA